MEYDGVCNKWNMKNGVSDDTPLQSVKKQVIPKK